MKEERPPDESVSVVIASYNMGRFLSEAVQSVLVQSHPPSEIHVIDDGSTDGTEEVMKRFSGVPSLVHHRQTNAGQAAAKNRGIRASSGRFVAFLDADDFWAPHKLRIQLDAFRAHPDVGIVHTNFAYVDEAGRVLGTPRRRYYDGWIAGRLLVDNFVNGMAALVRRECLEKVGLFDESLPMGIDYDLWLRLSAQYQFLFVDDVAYFYRKWGGQMSHNHRKRMECAIMIMERFLARHPDLVDRATIREAWAHTYVSRGNAAALFDGDRRAAALDYLRAIAQRPDYWAAWKAIARLLANRSRQDARAGRPAGMVR